MDFRLAQEHCRGPTHTGVAQEQCDSFEFEPLDKKSMIRLKIMFSVILLCNYSSLKFEAFIERPRKYSIH